MKREVRYLKSAINLEKRDDGASKITGYAAVFNSEIDLGYYTESIRKGAFARSLKETPDVRALLDHDTGMIIARTVAGNLTVREDDHGLKVEIEPIDTADGQKALEWVRSGVVDGMSFGFIPKKIEWAQRESGKSHRTLIDIELYEVSLVAFPAYPATSASVRSTDDIWKEHSTEQVRRMNSFRRRLKVLSL